MDVSSNKGHEKYKERFIYYFIISELLTISMAN